MALVMLIPLLTYANARADAVAIAARAYQTECDPVAVFQTWYCARVLDFRRARRRRYQAAVAIEIAKGRAAMRFMELHGAGECASKNLPARFTKTLLASL